MSAVTLAEKPVVTQERSFIGRAWVNTVQKEGPNKGKEFISISIDNTIASVMLKPGMTIQLWPNQKREGKQDADYRLSVVEVA